MELSSDLFEERGIDFFVVVLEFSTCYAFFPGSDSGEYKRVFGGLRHGAVGVSVVAKRNVLMKAKSLYQCLCTSDCKSPVFPVPWVE